MLRARLPNFLNFYKYGGTGYGIITCGVRLLVRHLIDQLSPEKFMVFHIAKKYRQSVTLSNFLGLNGQAIPLIT